MTNKVEVSYLYNNAASSIFLNNQDLFNDKTLKKVSENELDLVNEQLSHAIDMLLDRENDLYIKSLQRNSSNKFSSKISVKGERKVDFSTAINFLNKYS